MKMGIMGLFILSALASQSASAKAGDVFCHFPTAKGMAFLDLSAAETGYQVDLNVLGNRVMDFESARKSGNQYEVNFVSPKVFLTLDMKKTSIAPMGNTAVQGTLTLKVKELAVIGQNVLCEIKAK